MKIIKDMQFCISHIFIEDNQCVDKIDSISLQQNALLGMDFTPVCILDFLNRNRLGFTEFRFC
jgi:hypothetical protein